MHHDLGFPRAARWHRDPHDVVAGRPIERASGPGRGPVAASEHELDRRALDGVDAIGVHGGDGDADDQLRARRGSEGDRRVELREQALLGEGRNGARREHHAGGDGGDGGGAGEHGAVHRWTSGAGERWVYTAASVRVPGACHGTPGQTTMRRW